MTTLTYSKTDVDLVNAWLRGRDAEKQNAKIYHGDRPCLPAAALLKVCQRIFTKKQP